MDSTHHPREGQGTILVVDDDTNVLNFVTRLLENSAYNVLSASGPKEALQYSKNHPGRIDLLLSDFEMPGMTGIALATQISAERPAIRVLLMSGYTGGMLILNEGWHFLAKPFIASQLRALVNGLIEPNGEPRFQQAVG